MADTNDGAETVDTDAATEDDPFPGAILLCPVCSSQADADRWRRNEIECGTCGTEFVVYLVPEIVARYSIV